MAKNKSLLKSKGFYITLVVAIIIIYLVLPRTEGEGKYDAFASCLTEKGVVMYGTEWCPHCQNQKAMFGSSFRNINYVDCDRDRQACDAAGVQGYPTWVINGQSYSGEQPLLKLATVSGCELVEDD